jgi:hypothetical protein
MTKIKQDLLAIETMIYVIRNQRVMFDSDLALLYGVETKALNQAVKRNIDRFPKDFMFQLSDCESDVLRSQFVTAKSASKKRFNPYVFTENGVAMLSGILNSKNAIHINISIMRTFTKLRSFLAMETSLEEKVDKLEANTTMLFKIVFERLDDIENDLIPKLPKHRKKIGLKPNNE